MKIAADGTEIHCILEGPAGAPVVTLSHSLAADLHMWDAQAEALAGRYRVLRYDLRGHGASGAPPAPYSLGQLAEDVRRLLAALSVDRTHFVGLSLGGMIGQVLALESPSLLQSLTLCDTSSRVTPEAGPIWEERIETARRHGLAPLVDPTLERWFTPRFFRERPEEVERIRGMIRSTSVEGYVGCCRAIAGLDVADRLPEIRTPTLILLGDDDPGMPVAAARAMQERIPGAEMAVLPAAKHVSNIEQAEAFNQALTAFLARQ